MSIIVLMSGYTKDANIAISAFSIWYNLESIMKKIYVMLLYLLKTTSSITFAANIPTHGS